MAWRGGTAALHLPHATNMPLGLHATARRTAYASVREIHAASERAELEGFGGGGASAGAGLDAARLGEMGCSARLDADGSTRSCGSWA